MYSLACVTQRRHSFFSLLLWAAQTFMYKHLHTHTQACSKSMIEKTDAAGNNLPWVVSGLDAQ